MSIGQRVTVMDGSMSQQCAAPIEPGVEQDRLPEVAHDRKMRFQSADAELSERLGENIVGEHSAIKANQQRFHVGAARQIHQITLCYWGPHANIPTVKANASAISRPTLASSNTT